MKRRIYLDGCKNHPDERYWARPSNRVFGAAINLSITIHMCRKCSEYWVPRWVVEAEKMYDTQPDGYAGMGLWQFLQKMGAEKQ